MERQNTYNRTEIRNEEGRMKNAEGRGKTDDEIEASRGIRIWKIIVAWISSDLT